MLLSAAPYEPGDEVLDEVGVVAAEALAAPAAEPSAIERDAGAGGLIDWGDRVDGGGAGLEHVAAGGAVAAVSDLTPLVFEPNAGQLDQPIAFFALGLDFRLALSPSEAAIALGGGERGSGSLVRMRWPGGAPARRIAGAGELPGQSHYLDIGDASRSVIGVPRFAAVRYEAVYAGIDLVFYGREGELEYDWLVSPGADPGAIAIEFDGAEGLSIDGAGNLVIETGVGALIQRAPIIYQEIGGARRAIDGAYEIRGGADGPLRVGFAIGEYDRSRPLVIDPVLVYSTFLGGSNPRGVLDLRTGVGVGNDIATDVEIDADGNVYVLGLTQSRDFPMKNGYLEVPGDWGDFDFISKFDPGGELVYSTYFGYSTDPDHIKHVDIADLAVGADGSIYFTGTYTNTHYPPRPEDPLTDPELFVAKLDPSGFVLEYTTVLAGGAASRFNGLGQFERGAAIDVDDLGWAYIAGYTNSLDFPITPDAYQTQLNLGQDLDDFDAVLVILNDQGGVIYATYLGGRDHDYGLEIDVSADGRALVIGGETESPDFPVTANALRQGLNTDGDRNTLDDLDAFLFAADPLLLVGLDPRVEVFSTYIGGEKNDFMAGVAFGPRGDIFAAGTTHSRDFLRNTPEAIRPDGASYHPEHGGPSPPAGFPHDGWVMRIDPDVTGSKIAYFTYIGGVDEDGIFDLAVDALGSAYAAGVTSSSDFDFVNASLSLAGANQDAFVVRLAPNGSQALLSLRIGGDGADVAHGIGLDPQGGVVLAGYTTDVWCDLEIYCVRAEDALGVFAESVVEDVLRLFPVTAGAHQPEHHGGALRSSAGTFPRISGLSKDAFVARLIEPAVLTGVSGDAHRGVPFDGPVARFRSPRTGAAAGDFAAAIDWGDGSARDTSSARIVAVGQGLFEVLGTHTYEELGAYPVLVDVIDVQAQVPDPVSGVNLLDPRRVVNVSAIDGAQTDGAVAVDPLTGRTVVAAVDENLLLSLLEPPHQGGGLVLGLRDPLTGHWLFGPIGVAEGPELPPRAQRSPALASDRFGNTFLAYVGIEHNNIVLALSTDGGSSFTKLAEIVPQSVSGLPFDAAVPPYVDFPAVAVGPWHDGGDGVFVAYQNSWDGRIELVSARVTGKGGIGAFSAPIVLPDSESGQHPDVAIGPDGQVLVVWERPISTDAGDRIAVMAAFDPDGDKPEGEDFAAAVAAESRFGADPDALPEEGANLFRPAPSAAYDLSGGPHHGTAYIAYVDVEPVPLGEPSLADTDVFLVRSIDPGEGWSSPIEVNEDDGPLASVFRFFPDVAIDPSRGLVAVAWYDNGRAVEFPEQTDYLAAVSGDGGTSFSPEQVLSAGTTNAFSVAASEFARRENYGFGSEITFDKVGRLIAVWTDNSEALAPATVRSQLEIVSSEIGVIRVAAPRVKIQPLPIDARRGQPFSGPIALFTHPDPNRGPVNFEVVVDWGDGSPLDASAAIAKDGGVFRIDASHTFERDGTYPVWVTVLDQKEGVASTPVFNASERRGHQAEVAIAVDRTDPDRLFVASVTEERGKGIFVAYSRNGGLDWSGRILGDGDDGLPLASSDPDAAFDAFGNLFLTYLRADGGAIVIALSTDGGRSFSLLRESNIGVEEADYPKIATGPAPGGVGEQVVVAYTWDAPNSTVLIAYVDAIVAGRGQVGEFFEGAVTATPFDGVVRRLVDAAIGPEGQILVVYGSTGGASTPFGLFTQTDADGHGPQVIGLEPVSAADTFVLSREALVPAQDVRGITVQPNLAWDRSGGAHHGRVYLVYTDAPAQGDPDTDIYLVFSDDSGATWSAGELFEADAAFADELDAASLPAALREIFTLSGNTLSPSATVAVIEAGKRWRISSGGERFVVRAGESDGGALLVARERLRVNAGDAPGTSQFQSSIDVDQETGDIVVGWISTTGDASGNDELRFHAAVSHDGGATFSTPRVASPGLSDASRPEMLPFAATFQFGEYNGVGVFGGRLAVAWADNSRELHDNPYAAHGEVAVGLIGLARVREPLFAEARSFSVREAVRASPVVATFIDPDPGGATLSEYSAIISWGDGGPPTAGVIERDGAGFRVIGTHEYVRFGAYTTTVRISRGAAAVSVQGIANIKDASLEPLSQQIRVVEDVGFRAPALGFIDPHLRGVAGDFSAVIDWGDGSASEPGEVRFLGRINFIWNEFHVVGSHTYADEGVYEVEVTVTHNGVDYVGTSSFIAGDPSIEVLGQTPVEIGALENVPTPVVVIAEFEVLGDIDLGPGAYWIEIDWDDGTTTIVQDPVFQDHKLTVQASHAFKRSGQLSPTVTLWDDSGGAGIASVDAIVGRNIDDRVVPSASGLIFNAATDRYAGSLTVFNAGGQDLPGPFHILLDGLPPGVTLENADAHSAAGDPIVRSDQALLAAGGALAPLPLVFRSTTASPIAFTATVFDGVQELSGSGQNGEAANAIIVTNRPLAAVEGALASHIVATFTDSEPDVASEYAAVIDWGDGRSSAGIVVADPAGGFRVLGEHAYERYGFYPVTVVVEDPEGGTSAATSVSAALDGAGFVDYRLAIDTSALAGQTGFLSFQLNPSVAFRAQEAAAAARGFFTDGALHAGAVIEGGAAGELPGEISFQNGASLNRLIQGITFGSDLSLTLRISGDAIADPAPAGAFGSAFALQLLAADGVTPLLSGDASGAVLVVDVLHGGFTRFTAFAPAGGGAPAASAAAAAIATISDAALSSAPASISALEGVEFTGTVATFSDANPFGRAGEFEASIDWGDGTPPSAGIVGGDAVQGFVVTGTHVYEEIGEYVVEVTVVSAGGESTVAVPDAAPAGIVAPRYYLADTARTVTVFADVATADFNRDGRLDIASLNQQGTSPGNVGILLNSGHGTFLPAATYTTGKLMPAELAAGDFDGDGAPDLAVSHPGDFVPATGEFVRGLLAILLNAGDGTFRPPVLLPTVDGASSLAMDDLDHDGALDLVVGGDIGISFLQVFLGNGDGTFAALPQARGGFLNLHLATGDLDGDGVPDLVLAHSSTVSSFLGNGDGTFRGGLPDLRPDREPETIVLGDFDEDGILDLAVGVDVEDGVVEVFRGDGDGSFDGGHGPSGDPLSLRARGRPADLAASDFDGDGHLDLVVIGREDTIPETPKAEGSIRVWLGTGTGAFLPAASFNAGQRPAALAAGDFDGDGSQDLAVANSDNSVNRGIAVLFGTGDGAFVSEEHFSTGWSPRSVAAGDFDLDGVLDLAVAERPDKASGRRDDGSLSILLGAGNGAFQPPVRLPSSVNPAAVATGDIDGDGRLDVVAANAGGNDRDRFGSVAVHLGRPGGVFADAVLYEAGVRPVWVVLDDFDGDGDLDVAVANEVGDQVHVLLGRGDGTLAAAASYAAGPIPLMVRSGDVDGDGDADLLTANYGSTDRLSSVSVLLNTGNGAFEPALDFTVGSVGRARSLDVGDLNGDGKLDVVVSRAQASAHSTAPGSFAVFLGSGDGTFTEGYSDFFGVPIVLVTLGDFDGDGQLDVAAVLKSVAFVFRGNGDGTFQVDAMGTASIAGSAFMTSLLGADFDGDGHLDLAMSMDRQFRVGVARGNGAGGFLAAQERSFGVRAHALVVEDFDRDGVPDVAVKNELPQEGSISVRLGQGDGTFGTAADYATSFFTIGTRNSLAAGDFDEDGHIDLVASTAGATSALPGKLNVLFGTGGGGFGTPLELSVRTDATPFALAAADFDADGHLDVAVVNVTIGITGTGVSLIRGRGDGSFHAPQSRLFAMSGPDDLVAGDFNEDGRLDIAVSEVNNVHILFVNADGTLASPRALNPGFSNRGMAAADFNGDAHLDLVVAREGFQNGVFVLLGRGDGSFAPGVRYAAGGNASHVAAGDVDGDGVLDLVAENTGAAGFLRGRGDGTFEPVEIYLSDPNSVELALADLDADGALDIVSVDGTLGGSAVTVLFGRPAGGQAAMVSNAPIAAAGVDLDPVVDVPFTAVVATFADADRFAQAADFTATIDWGDGGSGPGTVTAAAGGGFLVSGTHAYTSLGDFTISVRIADDHGGAASAGSAARVNAADAALAAAAVDFTTPEDALFTGIVASFTDADPGGSPHDFSAVIDWGDGQVSAGTVAGDGIVGFTVAGSHAYALAGAYAVTVSIADIGGSSAAAIAAATVTEVNDAPFFASAPAAAAIEDAPYAYGIVVGDEDSADPASELRIAILAAPAWLALADHGDGTATLSGTPANGDVGAHAIVLRVMDGDGASSTQSFAIDVADTNDAPAIEPQVFVVDENSPAGAAVGAVRASDADAGDTLSFAVRGGTGAAVFAIAGATGAITVADSSRLDFEFAASLTLLVEVSDGRGGLASATVTVQLRDVNDAPGISAPGAQGTLEDAPLRFSAAGLNGISVEDVDSERLRVTLSVEGGRIRLAGTAGITVVAGSNGGAALTVVGSVDDIHRALDGLVFTPPADASGAFTLTVRARDFGTESTAPLESVSTVSIAVQPVNDAPALSLPRSAAILEDAAETRFELEGLSAGPAGEAGQTLTLIASSSDPALVPHPLVAIEDGVYALRFRPAANAHGTARISVAARDDGGTANGGIDAAVWSFDLDVLPVNDAPAAGSPAFIVVEDGVLEVSAPGLRSHVSDPDAGDAHVLTLVQGPAAGTVVLAADGSFRYLPAPDFNGDDGFRYSARDAGGLTATGTVRITVSPANDAPAAAADQYEAAAGAERVVAAAAGVLANDGDLDGDPLFAVLLSGPSRGVVALAADGSFAYTPAADFDGVDSFTYAASDGTLQSAPAMVILSVVRITASPSILVRESDGGTAVAEGGAGDVYEVTLSEKPLANVVVELISDRQVVVRDTGVPARAVLVFTPENWRAAQSVRVAAVDDPDDEAAVHAGAIDHVVRSADPRYDGRSAPRLAVAVADDDAAGILVRPASEPRTDEAGGSATFAIRLASRPSAAVTLPIASSDAGEGAASAAQLTFTPESWDRPQLLVVAGVDDDAVDGDVPYAIILGAASSADPAYAGLDPADVALVNLDDRETLRSTSFLVSASGFTVGFSREIDASVLNLYDSAAAGLGAPDVAVTTAAGAAVRGSLVVAADRKSITFIAAGGPLPQETLTATLRSAADGIRGARGAGDLLDGDGDGSSGGDLVLRFSSAAPPPNPGSSGGVFGGLPGSPGFDRTPSAPAVTVSLPDFARGPGQEVGVPAAAEGLPVRLSEGAGVERVELTIRFDPALLDVVGARPGAGLPEGATVAADLSRPGQARVQLALAAPLGAGAVDLLVLDARVRDDAPYGSKHVLDLEATVNGGAVPVAADDALHVVAYLGDATGNGGYSALDAQRVLRIAVGRDRGLAAFPLVDPALIADVTGNGEVSALDATRLLQETVGLERPEIPPLPGLVAPIFVEGPDPTVKLPAQIRGRRGDTVTVPLTIDDAAGVQSVEVELRYPTAVLESPRVRTGSLTANGVLAVNVQPRDGSIRIALALVEPLPAGPGSLIEIDFRIAAAKKKPRLVDLARVSLNEEGLVLTPAPAPGRDATDGWVLAKRGKKALRGLPAESGARSALERSLLRALLERSAIPPFFDPRPRA